jgi:hypothetical protein
MGSSRAGKSALTDMNLVHIQATRPTAMQVMLDTKPRYRAEKERGCFRMGRRDAAYRYESWRKGPTIPNSCVVDIWDEKPFKSFFKEPGEIAIMQGAEVTDWKRMLHLLNGFVNAQIKGRERRVVVDELLDFYQRNTLGIDSRNDVFYRTVRAGGERGIGSDFNLHRPHGAPPLIIAMASRINLFHLRMESDMKYLREAGIRDAQSPEGNYIFRQYQIEPGGTVSKPFTGKLELPDWYLSQLSET